MLEPLAIAFGLLGLTLCGALLFTLRRVKSSLSTERHADAEMSFSDFLVYGYTEDESVIRCKNGGLTTSWRYESPCPDSATSDSLEHNAEMLRRAISELGSGWTIHVDAVREKSAGYDLLDHSHFPDPVTRAIEEERAHDFKNNLDAYSTYFILTLTWSPSTRLSPLIDCEEFGKKARSFESMLSGTLSMSRLGTYTTQNEDGTTSVYDEQVSWLKYCITGERQPIQIAQDSNFLDVYLAAADFWPGIVPRVNAKHIGVVTITGFPAYSTPGMLNALTSLPVEARWSTRFIVLDRDASLRSIEYFKKRWHFAIEGLNPAVGQLFKRQSTSALASEMTADAVAAEDSARLGAKVFGYYTTAIVMYAQSEDELEGASQRLKSALAAIGFSGHVETINSTDAFIGSLPAHVYQNVRRPLITASNCSHLIPTRSVWKGERYAPCNFYPRGAPPLMYALGADDRSPFNFNLHVQDVGHSLVFGPTGAGKSTLVAMIAAQFRRYKDACVFCFDSGYSIYPLTKAVGGTHYAVANETINLSFAPMQYLETKEDVAWATEWLISIIELNGIKTTPAQKKAIAAGVMSASETGSKNTLTDVRNSISDHDVKDALSSYTIDGTMGHLLDATEDTLDFSNFTSFEISHLMRLGNKYAIPVLMYLFRRIERQLDGSPTLIVIDEAWIAFDHEVFLKTIERWLKELRKKNCAVLMSTQSLADATNSAIFPTIKESTATKIYLANPEANNAGSIGYYYQLGLNDAQIDIIANAEPKREYYQTCVNGNRLLNMHLGDFALSFVGVANEKDLGRIMDLEDTHGVEWPSWWLQERGIIEPSHHLN